MPMALESRAPCVLPTDYHKYWLELFGGGKSDRLMEEMADDAGITYQLLHADPDEWGF